MALAMDDLRLGDTVRLRNGETIVVEGVSTLYGDRDGEHPGPWVNTNRWRGRYLLSDVVEVVERNPRSCKFCGNGVTSTNPETDFCRYCYYDGTAFQEIYAERVAAMAAVLPEGWNVRPEHTGGGCWWFAVRKEGEPVYYAATDGNAGLPDPGEGWGIVYRYHEHEDHADYEGTLVLGVEFETQQFTERQVAQAIIADIEARS